jgi:antitoxin (DNA-binding transcriptional repressor) of toxin-antitoxin stability system
MESSQKWFEISGASHQIEIAMKMISLRHLRRNAKIILHRLGRGERFVLSYRGRPAAELEPLKAANSIIQANDRFLTIARRALPSPKRKTNHRDIDKILYGRKGQRAIR